ncbi:MAG: LytTR family transcriptional regulator [Cyclobacteriaceae bacterium]|jgi:hypothetical protein|nr:LytTR family transcriptional regulator [Cyclobacteriaceae bacterium]
MSWAEKLKDPFPFYLNDDRKNLWLIGGISLFVVAFMYFFKSSNERELPLAMNFLYGGITFVCLSVNILLLPRYFPDWFDQSNWNLQKYILLNLLHIALISVASTLVYVFYLAPENTVMDNFLQAISRVAIRGVIPIALTTLFLRNTMLKQNLTSALQANKELMKIQTLKNEPSKNQSDITLFSDTSETLTINLPDLLYIEADDNYSTVVWKSNGETSRKLLRVNLKSIESQIDNRFALRCHRSYLVNINAIDSISGNASGYKIKIKGTDFLIPVSRQKGPEVMEKISQWRNVMELS